MGFACGFLLLLLLVLGPSSSDPVRAPQDVASLTHVIVKAPTAKAPAAKPHDADPAGGDLLLSMRHLIVPVEGVPRSRLRDTFFDGRGEGRKHQAIDIMAPRGTPVLAADDGRVAKISSNRGGGLAAYLVDPSGRLVYYYAHLDGYAADLREGQSVRRGDVIGYVGTTGNAPESTPHLHFAVLLVAQERRWWGGEAINPYAALAGGDTVAASATAEQLASREARPTR
jgi:murein DD-endopeptidase MepM/ murein hydrolase activator NlpD